MDVQRIESLCQGVEEARKAQDYETMLVLAKDAGAEIGKDNTQVAWKFHAKLTYELHMAFWQMATQRKAVPTLDFSLYLAECSAAEATNAGDKAGALYAEMNISGLILPALGRWEEGMTLSEQVDAEAEALAKTIREPKEAHRAARISVNTRLHRIKMLMEHAGTFQQIGLLIESVERCPAYMAEKNQGWRDAVARANEYIS